MTKLFLFFAFCISVLSAQNNVSMDLFAYEIGHEDGRGIYLIVYGTTKGETGPYTCYRNDNPQFFDMFYQFVREIKAVKNRWVVGSTVNHSDVTSQPEGGFAHLYTRNNTDSYAEFVRSWPGESSTRYWNNTVFMMNLSIDAGNNNIVKFGRGAPFYRTMTENVAMEGMIETSSTIHSSDGANFQNSSGFNHLMAEMYPQYTVDETLPFDLEITAAEQGIVATANRAGQILAISQRENNICFNYLFSELKELHSIQSDLNRYVSGQSTSMSTSSQHSGGRRTISMPPNDYFTYTDWSTSSSSRQISTRAYPNINETVAPKWNFVTGSRTAIVRYADDVYRTLAKYSPETCLWPGHSTPTVVLQGANPLNVDRGTEYVDPGYIAKDYEGNPVQMIVTPSTINTETFGTHIINYSKNVSFYDSLTGETLATSLYAERTVNVVCFHEWGSYVNEGANHSRTCNKCGTTETSPHNFTGTIVQYYMSYHNAKCVCGFENIGASKKVEFDGVISRKGPNFTSENDPVHGWSTAWNLNVSYLPDDRIFHQDNGQPYYVFLPPGQWRAVLVARYNALDGAAQTALATGLPLYSIRIGQYAVPGYLVFSDISSTAFAGNNIMSTVKSPFFDGNKNIGIVIAAYGGQSYNAHCNLFSVYFEKL